MWVGVICARLKGASKESTRTNTRKAHLLVRRRVKVYGVFKTFIDASTSRLFVQEICVILMRKEKDITKEFHPEYPYLSLKR